MSLLSYDNTCDNAPSKRATILTHPLFCAQLKAIEQQEQERIFCKHGLSHLLDVCRLMQLEVLSARLPFSADVIYGAGLLHDIGRTAEEHHISSARLAEEILLDCGYSPQERLQITDAILQHRTPPKEAEDLAALLYRADKASRPCFCCTARDLCNWPAEKRNQHLRY